MFIPAGEGRFAATELARGPWDPGAQHGGAPAALLMRTFERMPASPDLLIARVTYELLRPVPLAELEARTEVLRAGRRTQLLAASLWTAEGVEVVRAQALRVHRAAGDAATGRGPKFSPASGPEDGRASDYPSAFGRMFAVDAMEIRMVSGAFLEPGPASAWFRLRVPLVAGEVPSPLQRLAAAADFGNGISAVLPWDAFTFVNPDLTLYLEREPVGDWFLLESSTRVGRHGIGLSESTITDSRGQVGRAIQALLVAERG